MSIPPEVKEIISHSPKMVTVSTIARTNKLMVMVYFMDESRQHFLLDGDMRLAKECVSFLCSHNIHSLVGMID